MEINTTTVFAKNLNAIVKGKRLIINCGGTSSSKSYSIVQLLIQIASQSEIPLLISMVSESFPHLRRGILRDFKNIMSDLWDDNRWSETNKEYNFGKAKIEFFSADDASKLRGGRRDILFINEANNVSKDAFDELDVRTRKFTIIDFNPVSEFWAHEKEHDPEVEWIHSTYLDALDVLEKSVIDNILSRKDRDPNWWRVYGLGLVGKLEGLIHPSFTQCDSVPERYDKEIFGLDFGFSNDPAAMTRNRIIGNAVYSKELLFEKGLTNSQLAARFESFGIKKNYDIIIADCAEPKSIEELKQYGYDVRPCVKGPDSLHNGIQRVNQFIQYWTKDSLNGIKEQRNYRWEKNSDGKFTDKPVHEFSHLLDSRRYAVATVPEQKVIQVNPLSSNFTINFKEIAESTSFLLSIWSEKNLQTSMIMAMWSARAGKMYVFAEAIHPSPIADNIIKGATSVMSILSDGYINTLAGFETWGNDVFFDEWGGDLSADFTRAGVWIRENKAYNEVGAIANTTRLISKKSLVIHSRCPELLKQVSQWRIEGKPQEGHGLARAVLSIVGTLYEAGKLKVELPLKEYSTARNKATEKANRIVQRGLLGAKAGDTNKNQSWMI